MSANTSLTAGRPGAAEPTTALSASPELGSRGCALGLRFWLAPWGALLAAQHIALRVAAGHDIRACAWERLRALHVGEAGAVIVGLPDGYAVHQTCARGVGALVARIYVIEPTPPHYDGTRASWKARQRWCQQRARQLQGVA